MRGDLARPPESWHDARALFRHPRPGSALESALDPEVDVTPDRMFLRDIQFMLRAFLFGSSTPPPEPVPLTEAERDAAKAAKGPAADLMTPEQALAALGLSDRRKEVSDGR